MSSRKLWTGSILIAVLTLAPSAGCKSGFSLPAWNPFAKTKSTAGLSQNSDGSFVQSSPQGKSSSWTDPFKKVGEAVTSPFEKSTAKAQSKPKEDDPIALTGKTTQPNAALYVSLAKLQERAGNTAAAVEEYNKALDADATNVQALLGLARLYDRQGRYDEAVKLYNTSVDAHPENASAWNDLGLCLARSGKLRESHDALQKAVALDPQKVLYRNNLATVLVEDQRPEEAFQVLVAAHGEAAAHYNVGYLLMKRERKQEAHRHFAAAARLDPNLKEAKQWCDLLAPPNETLVEPQVTPRPTTTPVMPSAVPVTPTPVGHQLQTAQQTPPAARPNVSAVPTSSTPALTVPSAYDAAGNRLPAGAVPTTPVAPATAAATPGYPSSAYQTQAAAAATPYPTTASLPTNSAANAFAPGSTPAAATAYGTSAPYAAPTTAMPPTTSPAPAATPAPAAAPATSAPELNGPKLLGNQQAGFAPPPAASSPYPTTSPYGASPYATPQSATPATAAAASQVAAAAVAAPQGSIATAPGSSLAGVSSRQKGPSASKPYQRTGIPTKSKPASDPVSIAREPKYPASRY